MSYRGEVYRQQGPPERESYYNGGNQNYGGPPQHDPYRRANHGDPSNVSYQGYDEGHDGRSGTQPDIYRDQRHSNYGNHQDRFQNQHNTGPPPAHRYPETFEQNDLQPRRDSSWERRNDPNLVQTWENEAKHGRSGQFGKESYRDQNGYDYRDRGRLRSPDNGQNYGRNEQYTNRPYDQGPSHQQQGGGPVRNDQGNFQPLPYERHNDGPTSPPWHNRDRNQSYPSRQSYSTQYGGGKPQNMNASRGYNRNEPARDIKPSSNSSRSSPTDIRQPCSQQRDGPSGYDRPEPPSQRQYQDANYRDTNYRQDNQRDSWQPGETPQILAKTSGSTAVFGVVARVDSSPTRPHALISPTRANAPPLTSPTRDYAPSFEQYRERESNHEAPPQRLTQQQHQYHHALTPISEKPSPQSSISSRGNPPENRPMKQLNESQDHYGKGDNSNQSSWHSQVERSHHERHQDQWNGPNYNDPQGQYHDRQPQSQQPRPGHRDYDYTESSGYGSESTHYTERSYNSEQQRYPDKGPYNSHIMPPPPQPQQSDNWPRSPTASYSHSPPKRPEPDEYRQQYRGNELRPPSHASQQYDQRNESLHQGQYRSSDSYGPPVSIQVQRPFDDRQPPPPDNRYGPQEYNRGQLPRDSTRPASPSTYLGGHHPIRHGNTESGVEESHVKSVHAAKNLFEKQSDPRRPPPAPKPIITPKPNAASNVNARPIPPRPRNLSEGGWSQQQNNNQYTPRSPPGPISPTNPHYDARPQQYQQRTQPSHSQSMDNLDDRSRYQAPPPQRQPQHAQSLQNLDDRSRYPDHSYQQRDQGRPFKAAEQGESSRNSYSGPLPPEERPMVLAVKYNPDTGPSVYSRQDGQRQGSWERPQREVDTSQPQPHYRSQPDRSSGGPYVGRNSWSADPQRSSNQQSYPPNARNAMPNQQPYNQPQSRNSLNDNTNFVPDVVARSYELANQSQQPTSGSQSYSNNHPQQTERKSDYRQPHSQEFRNAPEIRKSPDRWPTPPPPLAQDPAPPSQHESPDNRYTDDWRRLGPKPQNHKPHYSYQQEPRGYHSENAPSLQMPPPTQQPYPYDSESSEVDVDAPTPPPSGKRLRPPYLLDNTRSESPYERNKPIPVPNRNPPANQPQSAIHPPASQHQGPAYPKHQPQTFEPKSQPSEMKSPPPQKPQRNSTSFSPRSANLSGAQNDFDFSVGATQQLKHPSSIERQRLGKSGALANRKPPSRNNSSSNLVEIENDADNDYQIEVTDSDISNKPNGIEVHREISMRKLRAAKKDKEGSSDPLSTVLEKPSKQRASQRVLEPPSDQENKPSADKPTTSVKKSDPKLVYKMPSAEAAKTIPMPDVTEPTSQATRRPPTYTGFGYTPEKPKTDLLTQFKSARDSAMKTAAQKQDRALKSVSALVKFSQGKKEPKSPPKPKLTPAERNAKLLDKMHIEVKAPPEDDGRGRHSRHHKDHDERGNPVRSSVRSSSTVRPEKYDGDDDTTNGSRYERDRRGRGRERNKDTERGKSRGRSTSRGRNLSPDDRGRSRHRSKSRERSLSPDERRRPRREFDDRRYDERRHHGEDSSYHRRPPSPDRHRYDDRYHPRSQQHRPYPQAYDRHRAAREPDWVEQFRRGREPPNQPSRRAWVNDPRRVEVTAGGRRRELDMDAFEREVKRATSYNSDFEQQPEPRRQMIPSKLSSKPQANTKRQPPGDWMNALKERNKSAARARFGHVSRY